MNDIKAEYYRAMYNYSSLNIHEQQIQPNPERVIQPKRVEFAIDSSNEYKVHIYDHLGKLEKTIPPSDYADILEENYLNKSGNIINEKA